MYCSSALFSNYVAKYTKLTFVIHFNLSFKLNYVIKTDVKSAENRRKLCETYEQYKYAEN